MIVYRVSGEGLLRLAVMAATSPDRDVDVILGVVHGADIEDVEPELEPAAAAEEPARGGPADAATGEAEVAVKPMKPE